MSLRERAARDVGRGFGLFAVAFAVLALVVTMLSQVGLPGPMASVLVAAGTLVSFVVIGFAARTMNLQDFQVALRGVPPALNGMATAAAFLASAGFLGLAGAFFDGSKTVFAVVAGMDDRVPCAWRFDRAVPASVDGGLGCRLPGDSLRQRDRSPRRGCRHPRLFRRVSRRRSRDRRSDRRGLPRYQHQHRPRPGLIRHPGRIASRRHESRNNDSDCAIHRP